MISDSAIRPCHRAAVVVIPALLLLQACEPSAPAATESVDLCGQEGRLSTELYGDYQTALDWQADELACQGMPRPNGEGARLRLAGPAQNGSAKRSLAFILAMPELREGETKRELPTNVTFMEEGTGKFFATQDTENCWTDIGQHDQTGDSVERRYTISGFVYCLAPLAELNGNGSVSFTELSFTGLIDWRVPE